MAQKQTRHWYDRVAKTEKLPKGAWQSQYVARKLEKFSREGYRLVKVTNDMYSFDEYGAMLSKSAYSRSNGEF